MTDKQKTALKKLQESKSLFVRIDDIAPVLESKPQSLRDTAQRNVHQLGFAAIVVKSGIKIPRIPFLRWIGEDTAQEVSQC